MANEPNPWLTCDNCGSQVQSRRSKKNQPCGCRAGVVSQCPTWETADVCRCDDPVTVAAAEAARVAGLAPVVNDDCFRPITVLCVAVVILVGLAALVVWVLS